jgi:hypothetical protein
MYCHLLGFSLTLTPSASQDAGANCFCSQITGKNNKQTTSEEQMKFNKWTLGLAAVGAVSLASAVRADEAPKMSQIQTALSNTTISGYVDVAAQYNINHTVGNGDSVQPLFVSSPNSFSLNDVDIAIDKPEDDTPWA